MKIYNICSPEEYEKDGIKKVSWNNVGKIIETEKDGKIKRFLKLSMFPTFTYQVFEQEYKRKDEGVNNSKKDTGEELPIIQADNEEINIDDIPF